jgi:hypothetical protein
MSPYDIAGTNGRLVMRLMRLNRELEIFGPTGILTSTGGWASGHAPVLGAGYQYGGASGVGANSNPIADMFGLIHASPRGGSVEMDFWCNGLVAQALLEHPAIQSWMKFKNGDANGQAAALSAIKEGRSSIDFRLTGIGTVHVVTAQIMATPTSSLAYLMPDCLVGTVRYPGRPTNGMELATSYMWDLMWPGSGIMWNTREIELETRGAGGRLIIVEAARKARKVATIAGGIITGVLQ